jgi:membrane protein
MQAKKYLRLLKVAGASWSNDYAPSMGAALSYYTLFSIAPLLLIVIAVAGLVFGDAAARGAIFAELQGLIGDEGAKGVEQMLQAADKPKEGVISTVVGVIVLIIGATTVFGELQNALDRIWRAPAREKVSGWWRLLRTRLLSFGMVLGIAFLLMVSLVLSAMLSALGKLWAFEGWEMLAHALDILVSFGLTTVLFAAIYKFIPRVEVGWHDVWIGAAVTAVLFAIGKFLIGLYLGKSAVASSFGAAGSLAVLMVWVYYSAQIFLYGAEFTWVYANAYGSRAGKAKAVEEKPATALVPAGPLITTTRVPKPAHGHPVALILGAFAVGAVAGFFKSKLAWATTAGAMAGANALKKHSPLPSRRRRIFAAFAH